jgi:hypothetical protein
MANTNQTGILAINDQTVPGLLVSTAISFDRNDKTITAIITYTGQYTDDSPIFDYFIQNQPASLKLTYSNLVNAAGPTERTITFDNAVCKNYFESFDRLSEFNEFTDIVITITINAAKVAMGGTNFPG